MAASSRRISLRYRSFCWISGRYQKKTASKPETNSRNTTTRVSLSQILRCTCISGRELNMRHRKTEAEKCGWPSFLSAHTRPTQAQLMPDLIRAAGNADTTPPFGLESSLASEVCDRADISRFETSA